MNTMCQSTKAQQAPEASGLSRVRGSEFEGLRVLWFLGAEDLGVEGSGIREDQGLDSQVEGFECWKPHGSLWC